MFYSEKAGEEISLLITALSHVIYSNMIALQYVPKLLLMLIPD